MNKNNTKSRQAVLSGRRLILIKGQNLDPGYVGRDQDVKRKRPIIRHLTVQKQDKILMKLGTDLKSAKKLVPSSDGSL